MTLSYVHCCENTHVRTCMFYVDMLTAVTSRGVCLWSNLRLHIKTNLVLHTRVFVSKAECFFATNVMYMYISVKHSDKKQCYIAMLIEVREQ